MRKTAFIFATAVALTFAASAAYPETATREKCTCDLVQESEQNNGAWVRNATACWSSDNPNRQWCKIDVEEIERNGPTRAFVAFMLDKVRAGDVSALSNAVRERFEAYVRQKSEADGNETFDYSIALEQLPSLIDESAKEIEACILNFSLWHYKRQSGEPVETERIRCEVGRETGWLYLRFRFDGFDIRYMVAPNA